MGEKGFTLIEMLLVVAIIGFLVAILLPSVGGVGEGAKVRAVKADLRTLKSAIEVYFIAFGVYPPLTDWGTANSYVITPAVAVTPDVYSRFIDKFPVDPYGDGTATYQYALDTAGKPTYVIWSDKGIGATGTDPVVGDDTITVNDAELYVTNAKQ